MASIRRRFSMAGSLQDEVVSRLAAPGFACCDAGYAGPARSPIPCLPVWPQHQSVSGQAQSLANGGFQVGEGGPARYRVRVHRKLLDRHRVLLGTKVRLCLANPPNVRRSFAGQRHSQGREQVKWIANESPPRHMSSDSFRNPCQRFGDGVCRHFHDRSSGCLRQACLGSTARGTGTERRAHRSRALQDFGWKAVTQSECLLPRAWARDSVERFGYSLRGVAARRGVERAPVGSRQWRFRRSCLSPGAR